jgi:hypothetical protein
MMVEVAFLPLHSGKVYMFLKLYFVWKYIKIIFFLS